MEFYDEYLKLRQAAKTEMDWSYPKDGRLQVSSKSIKECGRWNKTHEKTQITLTGWCPQTGRQR